MRPAVQVVLPIQNGPLRVYVEDLYAVLSRTVRTEFVLCEDTRRGDAASLLAELARVVPAHLMLGRYQETVWNGLTSCDAPFLVLLEAGEIWDARQFRRQWDARYAADLVIQRDAAGWGRPPQCILAARQVVHSLLRDIAPVGHGYVRELLVCAHRRRYSVRELPAAMPGATCLPA